MWFHLELAGQGYRAALSGVAVADQPRGPYRFIRNFRPNAGVWPMDIPERNRVPLTAAERQKLDTIDRSGGMQGSFPGDLVFRRDFSGGQMARDMTLFVDDGGAAFHVYSSEENGTLHISQLTDDYLRPAGRCMRIFPGCWNEAPALFKYQGRYFMFTSGCTGWTPNPARLSAAESIWGPWKEIGNPCVGSDAQKSNTFESQPTFVLPVAGAPGAFIFMGDRWRPNNAVDGRYVWLPIEFQDGVPAIKWHDKWDLSIFNTKS
jgi:beta-xylosidase